MDVTDRAVITFVQGSLRREIGRTNSNASGVFAVSVRVPAGATPGRAVLEVRGRSATDDIPFTVTPDTLPLTGPSAVLILLGVAVMGTAAAVRRAAGFA